MAAEGIGLADDGAFSDAFDFVDAVFDFAGVDVFAVHDDEVFQAVDDVDVAVFVHVGEVAGMEPAVFGEDFLGFFGLVPVALHDVVAADEEFADGAATMSEYRFVGSVLSAFACTRYLPCLQFSQTGSAVPTAPLLGYYTVPVGYIPVAVL